MKLTEAAKRGRAEIVIDVLEGQKEGPAHGKDVDVQILLGKVCQDFHTVRKHPGHLTLARYLIARGAKPEVTMVCEAERGGHLDLIDLLLEAGLGPSLFTAAALGQIDRVAQILTENPSAARERDVHGMTPLHYCAASVLWKQNEGLTANFEKVCARLIDAGADLNALGTYYGLSGVSPLMYCAWTGGHPGVATVLLDNGASLTPVAFFAALGHFQRHGSGNYEIAERFLQRGFDVNHNNGRTALHAFSAHADTRGVSWLLEKGADVTARDQDGNTPLHLAARRNSGIRVLKLLLEGGANPYSVNTNGDRAIDLARAKSREKAVSLLGEFGDV